MKDYSVILPCAEATMIVIHDAFDKGYKQGYEDGKADTPFTDTEEAEKRAYEKGLNESWECARKMCYMKPEERLLAFDVSGNHLAILSDLTAPKAIAKIKAYEDKQKQDDWRDISSRAVLMVFAYSCVYELSER